MSKQSYSNHRRLVPGFHGLTWLLLLIFLGGAINNALKADESNDYSAWLLVLVGVILILLSWFTRRFALVAQDRAIRAEEKYRHLVLTGKPLPQSIKMSQVIALRFASDEEFPALVERAAAEKMSPAQIKKAIKNWRADYHRV